MSTPLLEVRGLTKHFHLPRSLLRPFERSVIHAVDGVSFKLRPAETLGLVGESGCGKSTTAKMLLRLHDVTDGKVLFQGREVQHVVGRELREYRRQIQAVFQDPYSSLNPRMRVGDIVAEPLVAAGGLARSEIRERVTELLSIVSINPRSAALLPHEFSGGQRQRIAIARGLALRPKVVVLDEPVSALDVSIRAQILNLLADLQERFELSYVLISHDLGVVAHMCTQIAVMYLGRIVEIGDAELIRTAPRHPYTKALFSAVLPTRPDAAQRRMKLTGEMPSPLSPPSGCSFHPRCPIATTACAQHTPRLLPVSDRQAAACHYIDNAAEAVGPTPDRQPGVSALPRIGSASGHDAGEPVDLRKIVG